MKKIYLVVMVSFFLTGWTHAQNWVMDENYEFNNPGIHDSQWQNGLPFWDYDLCSGWKWPRADNYGSIDYTDMSPDSSGNTHIQYTTIGTRSCMKLLSTAEVNYPYGCTLGAARQYESGNIWRGATLDLTSGVSSSYLYGKYEICCRIPKGRGLHYAFWMIDADSLKSGEIDILEVVNHDNSPPVPTFNLHSWSAVSPQQDFGWQGFDPYTESGIDLSLDFHKYSVEWNDNNLKFKVDDITRWMISKDAVPYFPQGPMALLVGIGVDPSWQPDPAENETEFPASLDIDYIRVYHEVCPSYVLCDNNTANTISSYETDLAIPEDVDYNGINEDLTRWDTTTHITNVSCPKTVGSNISSLDHLLVDASNKITMHPGFIADATASSIPLVYRAQIVACDSSGRRRSPSEAVTGKPEEMPAVKNQLLVYPNPGSGIFTVALNDPGQKATMEVYNANGFIIKTIDFNDDYQLDLSGRAKGIYLIKITVNGQQLNKKIVLE